MDIFTAAGQAYKNGYEKGSRETAEKIIYYLDTEIRNYVGDSDLIPFNEDIKYLKNQFGVEIKE